MSKSAIRNFNDMKELSDVIAAMIRLGVISAVCLLAAATVGGGGLYDASTATVPSWLVKVGAFVVAIITGLLSIAFAMLIVTYCGARFRAFRTITRLVDSHPKLHAVLSMFTTFVLLVVIYVLVFVGIARILPQSEMDLAIKSLLSFTIMPSLVYEWFISFLWPYLSSWFSGAFR